MILERIKEYIDFKGIPVSKFEKSIGMSNASFGRSLKNKGAIGTDKLENILNIYPDINPTWLCKGVGDMIFNEKNKDISQKQQDNQISSILLDRVEKLAAENAMLKNEIDQIKKQKKYRDLVTPDITSDPEFKLKNPGKNK